MAKIYDFYDFCIVKKEIKSLRNDYVQNETEDIYKKNYELLVF